MPRKSYVRPDGRKADQLRPVSFDPDVAPASAGSVLVRMGNTQVICGVSVLPEIPRWMKSAKAEGGWLTAEYSMLPYSTTDRARRDSASGRISGRSQEIQRLIGRSLRAVVDLKALGPRTIWVDCDVLQADGGTRTASITGSYVALEMAVRRMLKSGELEVNPIQDSVAAVSVGLLEGQALLDLCYLEDAAADVDMNLVMTGSGAFIELQGTAEESPFSGAQLNRMITLGRKGIRELLAAQARVLSPRR